MSFLARRCALSNIYAHRLFKRTIFGRPSATKVPAALRPTPSPLTSAGPVVAESGSEATDLEEPDLWQLPRPLGIRDRPTTKSPTWKERRDELMDQNVRMEKRRNIVKQATQGYFNDFNRLNHHGGKTWLSPKVLVKAEKALYLPNIEGERLDPREPVHTTNLCAGRISIVSIITTKASEEHVESFTKSSLEAYQNNPHFQFLQINLQENRLKSLVVSLFIHALKREVPPSLHPLYIISHQNMEDIRQAIALDNKHVGYVYLVDEDLKIRWAGCANPTPEEREALLRCTGVLLKRFDTTTR